MAHFALLWKARAVERYRSNYEREKLQSIALAEVELPRQRLSERLRSYRIATSETVSRTFSRWFPNGSAVYKCLLYMRSDETVTTFLMKSIIGFSVGIVLTYLCFIFLMFQLSISLIVSTFISSLIGVLLTLGLAFSYRIRCLVFLLIPQLFSRVGRYTLTCYALVLILTGPATNTLKNSEVLTESMACSQEQIKTSVHEINESQKTRCSSIKDNLKTMMRRFDEISKQLTVAVVKIRRLVLSVVSSVQTSFNWFKSLATDCDQKFGPPYNYCRKVLSAGVEECKSVFGPDYLWLCDINNVFDATCRDLMRYDSFCGVNEFIDDSIPDTVKKKLKTFSDRIASLLVMELHVHYSFSFSSNASHSASQVAAGIVTEIRNRADPLLTWLSWSSCVTSLFLLLILFRAKYYQQMYHTRSRFDNRYITQELRDLDLKRLRQGRETILPLTRRERAKYVTTTSFRLVPSEKIHLNRSAVFMTITTFKLMIHIVADYSLYWVLMTIQHHGKLQTPVEDELPEINVDVSQTSFVSRLFGSIVKTLTIPLKSISDTSPLPCLPEPYPPDLRRYMQIGALIFLLWFFALFEPYGLRLRHVVMGRYHPERAKIRATWLYNHILRTRGGFMKFARRKLHREYKYSSEAKYTFRKWINTHIPFRILRFMFGICDKEQRCLLCKTTENTNDMDSELISCKSMECPGVYCCRCFCDIGQLCTICLTPKDYGHLSDVSLEKGSSEDSDDSDHDNNGDTQFGNEDRWNSSNINDNHRNDKHYIQHKRKDKKEWNVSTRTDRRKEDELPFLSYCSYNQNSIGIIKQTYEENCNKGFTYLKIISCKLKKALDFYWEKLQIYFYFWNKNIQKTTKLQKFTYNYENLPKDFPETSIYNLIILMDTFVQYCFYRIEKHNHSIFITKGKQSIIMENILKRQYGFTSKRKKQYLIKKSKNKLNVKKEKYLTNLIISKSTLVDNDMAGHSFTEQKNKNQERKSKNCFTSDNKQRRQNPKNNKNKKIIKQYIDKHNKVKTRSFLSQFNVLFFNCWKQSRLNILSCNDPLDAMTNNNPNTKQMKNHKRRKKRNKIDLKINSSFVRPKSNLDDIKKLRIIAYFSDQEWAKKKSNTKIYNIKFESAKREPKNIPTLENRSTLRPKNYPNSEYQKYIDKMNDLSRQLAKKLIIRIRDSIGLKQQSTATPSKVFNDLNTQPSDQITGEFSSISPQPSTSFSRRINFYRSLGVNEFDDIYDVVNANERNNMNEHKIRSSWRFGKGKGSVVKNNTETARNKGCGTQELSSEKRRVSIKNEISNKKWMHIKIKNPLYAIKEFCSSVTSSLSKDMGIKRKKGSMKTASKGVSVKPVTQSFSCQFISHVETKDVNTQTLNVSIEEKHLKSALVSPTSDTAAEMFHKNCTCATQRIIVQRDVGTFVNHLEQEHREYIENDKINNISSSDVSMVFSNLRSAFSLKSNGTNITSTTVLSLPVINYNEDRRPKRRNGKVKIITKTNQATATEKATVCDISTVTEDWWSPILERRKEKVRPMLSYTKRKEISLENTGGFTKPNGKTRKRLKNRGMMTDGKIVTFKSRTQIIPAEIADILSPSRYLLESQKYYNELFLSKYYGGRTVPVLHVQKQGRIKTDRKYTDDSRIQINKKTKM